MIQYTNAMVKIVYEVRRIVEKKFKKLVRLTNPELLKDMAFIYRNTDSPKTRELIESLMELAGPEWSERIKGDISASSNTRIHSILQQSDATLAEQEKQKKHIG